MCMQIEELIQSCKICQTFQNNNQKEPMLPHEVPERPWQKLGVDLFEFHGKEYLLIVDYYSKFLEVCVLEMLTSKCVVMHCKTVFARHGIPETVITDNGPQFNSKEFEMFAKEWNFVHVTSSPYCARSNGMAERTIQTVKKVLKKSSLDNTDIYLCLLDLRNTPVVDMQSPAQLLMGRRLRTRLPIAKALLQPEGVSHSSVKEQLKERQKKQKHYYDHGAKLLPPLNVGERVTIQKEGIWQPATVIECHQNPRSYVVETQDARLYRRNRRALQRSQERMCEESHESFSLFKKSDSMSGGKLG